MNLATATPVEIDTLLAELHGRYTTARMNQISANKKAWTYEHRNPTYSAQLKEQADGYKAQAEALLAEMAPMDDEYVRRGRWTRAFVVADGHVHSSMDCSTCNNGQYPTEFGWVTEFSGKTEAEVVEAAGSRACTVCYPTAPVDAPAGRIFHATEIAAQAAREEREAKRAAAAAKKAANAFGPYKITADRFGDTLDTVHKAKAFLTDGFQWNWDHPWYLAVDRDTVAAMLGEKLGTTAEEQLTAAAKRAANRT